MACPQIQQPVQNNMNIPHRYYIIGEYRDRALNTSIFSIVDQQTGNEFQATAGYVRHLSDYKTGFRDADRAMFTA